jgi:hypothetical protein
MFRGQESQHRARQYEAVSIEKLLQRKDFFAPVPKCIIFADTSEGCCWATRDQMLVSLVNRRDQMVSDGLMVTYDQIG